VAQRIQSGMQHVTDIKPHERDHYVKAVELLSALELPLVAAVEDYVILFPGQIAGVLFAMPICECRGAVHQLHHAARPDQISDQKLQIRRQINSEHHVRPHLFEIDRTVKKGLDIVIPRGEAGNEPLLRRIHHQLAGDWRKLTFGDVRLPPEQAGRDDVVGRARIEGFGDFKPIAEEGGFFGCGVVFVSGQLVIGENGENIGPAHVWRFFPSSITDAKQKICPSPKLNAIPIKMCSTSYQDSSQSSNRVPISLSIVFTAMIGSSSWWL